MSKRYWWLPWSEWYLLFKNHLYFMGFAILCMTLYRIIFVVAYHDFIGDSATLADIARVFLLGFRLDCRIAAIWMLLPFFMLILEGIVARRGRFDHQMLGFWGVLFIITTQILCLVSFFYYQQFKDVLNYRIYDFIRDDTSAILTTIYKDYPIILGLVFSLVVIILASKIWHWLLHRAKSVGITGQLFSTNWMTKLLCTVMFFVFIGLSLWGFKFSVHPLGQNDTSITTDRLLNKAVINPQNAFGHVLWVYAYMGEKDPDRFFPHQEMQSRLKSYFNTNADYHTLDAYMKREANGVEEQPQHVFLIMMEGYDAWPLLPKYADLNITNQLKSLAKKGVYFKHFLPTSQATINSYGGLVIGMPDAQLLIPGAENTKTVYPSSMAHVFEEMGYKSRLFYGGYLSRFGFGEFAKKQGFDEIYGASHVKDFTYKSEWGVDDESLFRFILDTVKKGEKSFSFIVTTSNHPPDYIDYAAEGFDIEKYQQNHSNYTEQQLRVNHKARFWYADRELGEFVEDVEAALPKPLFAFTGDHYGYHHPNYEQAPLFEINAVPFIMYGTGIPALGTVEGTGTHVDVLPTLVERVATKGTQYHALGFDLLQKDPQRIALGPGATFLYQGQIFDIKNNQYQDLAGNPITLTEETLALLEDYYHTFYGIAWARMRFDNQFGAVTEP